MHHVICDACGMRHVATPAHVSPTQGQIYEVVCTRDQLSDFYTAERVIDVEPTIVRKGITLHWSDALQTYVTVPDLSTREES